MSIAASTASTTTPNKPRPKNSTRHNSTERWAQIQIAVLAIVTYYPCPVDECPRSEDTFRKNDNLTQHLSDIQEYPVARQKNDSASTAARRRGYTDFVALSMADGLTADEIDLSEDAPPLD